MLNSHWGRAAKGKRSLASMRIGSLQVCPTLCGPVVWGLQGLSVRGFLQAGILERIGHYRLSYPSRALYFLLPWPPTPEYLVLPEPLQPKQLHHLHSWPSQGKPKSSRAASGANPSGRPTCRSGNKNHNLNPGAVWLKKKTQNLPTSFTSYRLNPRDQLGRLCVWGIYKGHWELPQKKTH